MDDDVVSLLRCFCLINIKYITITISGKMRFPSESNERAGLPYSGTSWGQNVEVLRKTLIVVHLKVNHLTSTYPAKCQLNTLHELKLKWMLRQRCMTRLEKGDSAFGMGICPPFGSWDNWSLSLCKICAVLHPSNSPSTAEVCHGWKI